MTRTTLRTALLTALAIGPALAQAPAATTPVAPMPGMSGNGMAMQPGMSMPGMKPGMGQAMSPPAAEAPSKSANDAEMMQKMEVMNKAMMGAPMTGNPDQDLVSMMMPHHQGAIDMARIYLRDGKDPEIRRMAQSIITDQEKEIAEFKAWQAKHPVAAR
jgi:uncharacterized protein (DUF305 family)